MMTMGGEHEMEADDSVVYQTEHDPADGTELSTSVLMALDSTPGFDIEDSDSIVFDTIDLEALDDLFRPATESQPCGHVTFPADEYKVTVTAANQITVRERQSSTA